MYFCDFNCTPKNMKVSGLDVHKDSIFCAIFDGKAYSQVKEYDSTIPMIRQMGEYLCCTCTSLQHKCTKYAVSANRRLNESCYVYRAKRGMESTSTYFVRST